MRLQCLASHGRLTDRGGYGEPRTHSAGSISLMRLWPAEVDQHAIANIAGNEAIERLDGGGDTRLIGADDLAQILGIKPGGERGGADEIAEHHAERAAFG